MESLYRNRGGNRFEAFDTVIIRCIISSFRNFAYMQGYVTLIYAYVFSAAELRTYLKLIQDIILLN